MILLDCTHRIIPCLKRAVNKRGPPAFPGATTSEQQRDTKIFRAERLVTLKKPCAIKLFLENAPVIIKLFLSLHRPSV